MSTKVSVLMTAFNRELYISEAIESVLAQTHQNFELIVVDDCSKDGTVGIVEKYQQNDERICLYKNERNLGDYPNRNRAASLASGEFIMFVDSDDTIEKDAIKYVLNAFKKFPKSEHSSIYFGKDFSEVQFIESSVAIRDHFFRNNTLAGGPGARFYKKAFYDKLNGYPEKYGPANDMYLNIYSTMLAPILMLPYNYLNYRRHETQEQNNSFSYLYNGYNYLNDLLFLPHFPLNNKDKNILYLGNKRRFIVNSFKFLFKKKSMCLFLEAYVKVKFSFKDFIIAFGFSKNSFN